MKLGKLHLIIGPMFSGKTTEMLRLANRHKVIGKKILYVNHLLNNRYNGGISTHDNINVEYDIQTDNLNTILSNILEDINVIIIDELQFYTDSYDWLINILDNYNITIICSCLNGDFMRESFEIIPKVLPHADHITKLSSLCKHCNDGTLANFSKRLVKNNKKVLVGTDSEYEAVCRYHYLN